MSNKDASSKKTKTKTIKKPANSKTAPKRVTKKPAAIAGMFFFGLAAAIIAFVMIAKLIVVNECGSPCEGGAEIACPTVCVRVTLWDEISNAMRKILSVSDRAGKTTGSVPRDIKIKSAGQYGDILIKVGDDGSISVEYNEDIVCFRAPCPQPRMQKMVNFSASGMSIVRAFLSHLPSVSGYENLSYQDKRILMSMILDEEENISRYEFEYRVDVVRYHIVETSGEISITYEDRMQNKTYDMTPEEDGDIEAARELIHDYCEKKNNYIVYMQSYDFIPEETRATIEHLLHLDDKVE